MNRIPLALLEAFAAVARAGNLTRAAETMHVTVSALSHRMRQLEDRLGTRVFVRGPRGVSLTPAGRRLFGAIDGPLADIERALQGFQRSGATFTVSATSLLANGWLVPRLPDFVARHPQVKLNLHSDAALVDFEREPIDAAIRGGAGGWPGIHSEHLFDEWVSPVASPALLKQLGGVKQSALARAPLLGDPSGLWSDWFARYGGAPPSHFVAGFNDSEALIHAAVQGLGVALGREILARPLIEAGRLVALSRRRLPARFGFYLVFPSRSREHRGFLAFRTWVYEQIGRPAPPLPA
jgi:LysR family glycine cleavage system transcriptional activator